MQLSSPKTEIRFIQVVLQHHDIALRRYAVQNVTQEDFTLPQCRTVYQEVTARLWLAVKNGMSDTFAFGCALDADLVAAHGLQQNSEHDASGQRVQRLVKRLRDCSRRRHALDLFTRYSQQLLDPTEDGKLSAAAVNNLRDILCLLVQPNETLPPLPDTGVPASLAVPPSLLRCRVAYLGVPGNPCLMDFCQTDDRSAYNVSQGELFRWALDWFQQHGQVLGPGRRHALQIRRNDQTMVTCLVETDQTGALHRVVRMLPDGFGPAEIRATEVEATEDFLGDLPTYDPADIEVAAVVTAQPELHFYVALMPGWKTEGAGVSTWDGQAETWDLAAQQAMAAWDQDLEWQLRKTGGLLAVWPGNAPDQRRYARVDSTGIKGWQVPVVCGSRLPAEAPLVPPQAIPHVNF
jgi:hypothetical protein